MPQRVDPTVEAPLRIRPFDDADEDAVVVLWERCELLRPWNDPRKDIARKRAIQRDLFLVVDDATVVASVMAGHDGHRGWINYLAVDARALRRASIAGCATAVLTDRRARTKVALCDASTVTAS